MRDIDSTIVAELRENEIMAFYCLHMIIDSVSYRFTDCDVPVVMPNDLLSVIEDITLSVDQSSYSQASLGSASVTPRYLPMTMKVSPVSFTMNKIVDKVTIDLPLINNPDLLAAFVGGTPQGSRCILRKILFDSNHDIVGSDYFQAFDGEIDGWNTDEEILKITVINALVQWNKKTVRKHGSSCSWKVFKGQDKHSPCFYAGSETWCDRTYTRCQALGNTSNFGGFRWLVSITDKEIWWGREKKDD